MPKEFPPKPVSDDGPLGEGPLLASSLIDAARLRRALCSFVFMGDRFVAHPQRPFQPRGLLVWGLQPGDTLIQAVIAANYQALVTSEPVPARWFAQSESYEQIAKKLDEGQEPPAWVEWDTVIPGQRIELHFRDAEGQILSALGTTVTGRGDAAIKAAARARLELVMWGVCTF